MFAALEFMDFFWIWIIVSLAAGGIPVSTARLEAKVDRILKHLGVAYHQPVEYGPHSLEQKRGIIVGIIAVALLLGFVIFQWLTGR